MGAFIAIWFASLLGSVHCAGMCGGFVAVCSRGSRGLTATAPYHAGRGGVYLILGFLSGLLGHSTEELALWAGFQHAAGVLMGAILVAVGLGIWLQGRLPTPRSRWLALWRPFLTRPTPSNTAIVGALSAALPCGWLYSYVAVAAGTADPLRGAGVMLAFWLGTLPLLASVGLATGFTARLNRTHLTRIVAAVFVIAGLYSLFTHFAGPPAMGGHGEHHHQ